MIPSRSAVAEILEAVTSLPISRDADTRRADLPAWDSVKHIEFIFALEDSFGVVLPEATVARVDSVDAAVQILGDLGAA